MIKVLVKAKEVRTVLAQAGLTEAEEVTVRTVYTRKHALTSYQSLISTKVSRSMKAHQVVEAIQQMEAQAVVLSGFQQPAL